MLGLVKNALQMKWDGEWRGWMDMWGLSGGAESVMEGAIESFNWSTPVEVQRAPLSPPFLPFLN